MLESIYSKDVGRRPATLLKKTPTQLFSREFAKFLRTTVLKNIYEQLLLPIQTKMYWKLTEKTNACEIWLKHKALLLWSRRWWGERVNLKTGGSRKQCTSNFPQNRHFLPPDTHTHVCISENKKCLFCGKFDVFCFLEIPVLRFALSPYYRRL